MRSSSTTCTVTTQPPSSSDSSPSTDSIGRPRSSGSSLRTFSIASRPDSRLRPERLVPFCRLLLLWSAIGELRLRCLAYGEPFHQSLLELGPLLLVDLAVVIVELQCQQLPSDVVLVVEFAL